MSALKNRLKVGFTYNKEEHVEEIFKPYLQKSGLYDIKITRLYEVESTNEDSQSVQCTIEFDAKDDNGIECSGRASVYTVNRKGDELVQGMSLLQSLVGVLGKKTLKGKIKKIKMFDKEVEAIVYDTVEGKECKLCVQRTYKKSYSDDSKIVSDWVIKRFFSEDGRTSTEMKDGIKEGEGKAHILASKTRDRYDGITKEDVEDYYAEKNGDAPKSTGGSSEAKSKLNDALGKDKLTKEDTDTSDMKLGTSIGEDVKEEKEVETPTETPTEDPKEETPTKVEDDKAPADADDDWG